MASRQAVKRPIKFFVKELNAHKQPRNCFSSLGDRADQFSDTRWVGNPNAAISYFARRFNSTVSASDQMSLIRQLRERTSAPIKDVKSALVGCNWDIGNILNHSFSPKYMDISCSVLLLWLSP